MTAALQGTSAREAGRGSAIRLAAEVVVRFSSIVATLWLTRSLGVAAFGSFLLCLSVGLMLAELCDLGLNAIVVPLLVRDRENLRPVLVAKARMSGGVALLSAALIPLGSRLSGADPFLLALATAHFLGASWIDLMGSILRSLGRRIEEGALLFVFRFTLVGLVIAAPFGMSVGGAARAYAVAVAPAALFGWFLLRGEAARFTRAPFDLRAILRQAAPLGVNGYLAILSTRVEIFILQLFWGEASVGLFGGALRIVESLLTLPSAIAAGALPSVARDLMRGTSGAAQRTFGLVVWFGVPAALGISFCAPAILGVLGPGFIDAAPTLRILSLALFLCFVNAALFHILIAAGDTASMPWLTAFRLVVAALVGVLLIPGLGLLGAALSFTVAEAFLFGALVRKTRAHAELEVLRPLRFALLASLPMIALLSTFHLSLPASIFGGACLFGGAGAVILRRGTEVSGLA